MLSRILLSCGGSLIDQMHSWKNVYYCRIITPKSGLSSWFLLFTRTRNYCIWRMSSRLLLPFEISGRHTLSSRYLQYLNRENCYI